MHLTIFMAGDPDFFAKFGKLGTTSDLLIRHQVDGGNVYTFVTAASDKIQPLIQAIAMADCHVIVAESLTPALGEILIGLHESGCEKGLIVSDAMGDQIKTMTAGMTVATYPIVSKDERAVWEWIRAITINRPATPIMVPIDTSFAVKGVGTVALGLVKSGTVKQYDKLILNPLGTEIVVKSMQAQDKDTKETEPGMRIGLALKGVEADEIRRGFVASDQKLPTATAITLTYQKNKYAKYEFTVGKRLMVACGLHITQAEVIACQENRLELKLESPLVCAASRYVLASTDVTPRIIGSGTRQ